MLKVMDEHFTIRARGNAYAVIKKTIELLGAAGFFTAGGVVTAFLVNQGEVE